MTSYERSQAVFVISVAAELSGLHAQTLRMYERKGLLQPSRTAGKSRRYSQADIDRLQRIQELTESGLNLEGVKRVIELEEEVLALKAEVGRLEQEVLGLHRQYKREIVPFGAVTPFPVWRQDPTG